MKAASLFFLILSIVCYLFVGTARAQVATCDGTVPFYLANMTGMPHGTWTSPSHTRKGNCCSTGGSIRCTSFRVITDTAAVLLNLQIISGSIPGGSLFYQVSCGPMQPLGQGMWLTASTTYDITFCEPGNNANVYQITTYSKADTVITGNFSAYTCGQTNISIGVPGGVWSSSNTSVATVNSSTGVVTGISVGTANISYVLNTVLIKTVTVTINPTPPITGTFTVCVGGTTALSNAASGGTWSSSNTASATIGSTGVVSGVSTGTSTITYTLGTGCSTTAVVTVNQTVPPITGGPVCATFTTTMGNATPGGTWTSGSTGVATIGSASGVANGVSSGTANITYTITGGCRNTGVLTVNPLPSAISGPSTGCVGATTTLSEAPSGGTWISSNGTVATVGSSSGVVSGLASGTTTVTYTTVVGCRATLQVTVNNSPVISGLIPVCESSTISLSASITGGTWSRANGKVSINASTGVVTGVTAGTVRITYQLPTGCMDVEVATVNPLPAISGLAAMCVGNTNTLTNSVAGGAWISSNGSIATVGSSSGIVSGIAPGTFTITYTTAAGCKGTKALTVNANPVVSGNLQACAGYTTSLNSTIAGGTWSSGNTAVATIDSISGVVAGIAAGSVSIFYLLPTGCNNAVVVTVNPVPAAISGPLTVCVSNHVTLSDGTAGGTWSAKNVTIATVDTNSGIVTGVSAGQTYVSYILPTGCWARSQVTVNTTPVINDVAPTLCVSSTVTLSANVPGGTWSSSDITVASIDGSSGVTTGLAAGSVTITYQLATGCMDTTLLTVGALPVAISGAPIMCTGTTETYSNSIPGGSWTTSDPTVGSIGALTGVFNATVIGTTTITYLTASGCKATKDVTVSPVPAITMASSVCTGGSMPLSSSVAGGTWSCSAPSIASINAALGTLSGVAAGSATISYALGVSCVTTSPVNVNLTPTISGAPEVCSGSSIMLTNDVPGGSWSCGSSTVGSIDSTGLFSGMAAGTTTVSYTCPAGCSTATAINVNQVPTVTGKNFVCINLTTQLNSDMIGGVWSSGRPDTASVSATGLVTGLGGGTAMISYTTAQGCIGTKQMRVNTYFYPLETSPLSSPLRTNICLTTNLQLNSPYGGDGHWMSSDTTVATVSNFVPGSTAPWGLVRSVSLGTVTISYTASNGCTSTHTITINPMPVITTAPPTVCRYGYVTLNATPAVGGSSTGQWISQNLTTCQVGSFTGVVHASTVGVAHIAYRTFTYDACSDTVDVTVVACTPRAGTSGASVDGYSIYPNPGTSRFTITQDVIEDRQVHTVVTNSLGQSVYNGKVSFISGEGTLELPTFSPGIYFVQIEGRLEEKVVLRIAVQ